MFERFTTSARVAVVIAQEEARRLGHRRIDTPHLLLALLRAQPGPGPHPDQQGVATVLRARGLTPEAVEEQVRVRFDRPRRDDLDDSEVLAALGIDVARIRAAVEANFGPGALDRALDDEDDRPRGLLARLVRRRVSRAGGAGHLPFDHAAKKALELSLREAIRLQDRSIDADHLVLGLLRGDDEKLAALLGALDVDVAALRADVERRRRRSA